MFTLGFVSKGVQTLEIPLLKVVVGNPNLLEVKVEGHFDDTDSYLMEISAASKTLRQVSFSLIIKKYLWIIENSEYKLRKRRKIYA